MQVFSNGVLVQYGFTGDGYHTKTMTKGDVMIMKCTPNIKTFLTWMVEEDMSDQFARETEKAKLLAIIGFWELRKGNGCFRGSFNLDHYQKVLQAKSKNI